MASEPFAYSTIGGRYRSNYDTTNPEGAATRAAQLLRDRKLRERMGENGYQHVKQNFLVTRHVKDYILIMLALEHPGESVVQLN